MAWFEMQDAGEYYEPSWFDMWDMTPIANFSLSPQEGYYPLTVQFTDLSQQYPTSWHWEFGDSKSSTKQHPQHTYAKAGSTYNISLIATNGNGSNTKIGSLTVSILQADFSAQPRIGKFPLIVHFTDLSIAIFGISSWLWDFGDGTVSTKQNPSHVYREEKSYTVSLTVTYGDVTDTETKVNYINATGREERIVRPRGELKLERTRIQTAKRQLPIKRLLNPKRDPPPKRVIVARR